MAKLLCNVKPIEIQCSWLFWAFESPPRCLPSIIEVLEEGLDRTVLMLFITTGVTVYRLFFLDLNKPEYPCFSGHETSAF